MYRLPHRYYVPVLLLLSILLGGCGLFGSTKAQVNQYDQVLQSVWQEADRTHKNIQPLIDRLVSGSDIPAGAKETIDKAIQDLTAASQRLDNVQTNTKLSAQVTPLAKKAIAARLYAYLLLTRPFVAGGKVNAAEVQAHLKKFDEYKHQAEAALAQLKGS